MNNFDFNSKKYMIYMGILLVFLFLVVISASQMLQNEIENPVQRVEQQSEFILDKTDENNGEVENTEAQDDLNLEEQVKQTILNNKTKELVDEDSDILEENVTDLDLPPVNNTVSYDNQIQNDNNENPQITMYEANKLFNSKEYDKALEKYTSIVENTSDEYIKAECYERVANIYAKAKKYGSALRNANKAANIKLTPERELLLARLYYKTGEIDRATKIVLDILQRDFLLDK